MIKVLLDTNVVISGLLYRGKPFEILRLAEQGHIALCTTPRLFEEFFAVVQRKKFSPRLQELRLSPEALVAKFATLVRIVPLNKQLSLLTREQPRDPSDAIVILSALSAAVEVLVSGDQDILDLKEIRSVRIVSPDEFMETELWKSR